MTVLLPGGGGLGLYDLESYSRLATQVSVMLLRADRSLKAEMPQLTSS